METNPVSQIVGRNKRSLKDYQEEFERIFNRQLSRYIDLYTGFDVIKFDEFIRPEEGVSTHDTIVERYGEEAVELIYILIGKIK